jgi:hypothetical protein
MIFATQLKSGQRKDRDQPAMMGFNTETSFFTQMWDFTARNGGSCQCGIFPAEEASLRCLRCRAADAEEKGQGGDLALRPTK